MAARKTSTRKKSRVRGGARGALADALDRLELELPPTLRDYARQARRQLDRLEGDLLQAQSDMRKRLAGLLREASHQLGRVEAEGEAGWRRLASPYRSQLLDLMKRIEKALAPQAAKARRTARKTVRKARQAASAAAESLDDDV
jgi:hypothetical protein